MPGLPGIDSASLFLVRILSGGGWNGDVEAEGYTYRLSAFFGAVAVMLACVGVFGVMASYVARRTNEFGIRFALGAQRKDVVRTVLFEVATVVAIGIVLGLIAAVSVKGVARDLLFGLKPTDPFTFATATLVLVAAALLAGCVPAWRAANVDPTEALRAE